MAVLDGKDQFVAPRPLHQRPGWRRFVAHRGRVIMAWRCRAAGDEAGYQQWMAAATEAPTMSLSVGPPVPIADRRPDPPALPEEP